MEKILRVQEDINDVTDLMRQNIESVVDRGEHLELLMDKSDGLSSQANAFKKQSTGLRKAMWWQNIKKMLLLAFVLVVVLCVIVFSMCGFTLEKCRSHA